MEPQYYQAKRYTLMLVCCISIVENIVFAAMTSKLVDEAMKHVIYPPKTDIEAARTMAFDLMIAGFVITIVFQLFGLIGAWREHICLTYVYTVVQLLDIIGLGISAITHPFVWINTTLNVLASIVAIVFLIDLRTIRNSQTSNP